MTHFGIQAFTGIMCMREKKFLLYPLFLFLGLFLFDKLFLLDKVKDYIKSDFTYLYYEAKEDIYRELLNKYGKGKKGDKKLMVVLGSSRLLYFDARELEEYYPDWDIYNLSSAVTTPAYYYYYLEKLLDNGVKPEFILLEADPYQFNDNTPVFRKSNLTYSFDPIFILRHAFLFGKTYLSFYFGKFLFASGKNKPYIDTALSRLQEPEKMKLRIKIKDATREALLKDRGHALSPVASYVEKDFAVLKATSDRTLSWIYSSYKPSDMQYTFYEKSLKLCKENQIPLVIVWPQTSIPMQELIRKAAFASEWEKRASAISKKYSYKIWDMDRDPDYYCNSFADGGHMAKDCYRKFIRYAMVKLYNIKKGKQE